MYRIAHWELMKRLIELGQTPLEKTAGSSAAPIGATDLSRLWPPTAV
jgi:hypothetical protein